jgi:peptide deformylase
MAEKSILIHPDSLLRRVSAEVSAVDESVNQLLADLHDTLGDSSTPGIGLAAVQIGDLRRVVLADVANDKPLGGVIEMINPKIIKRESSVTHEEGCLSMPDVWMPVTRAGLITVKFVDRFGRDNEIDLSGYCASVVQHEIDHLDGRLIIDYLSPLKKKMIERKLYKAKKRA